MESYRTKIYVCRFLSFLGVFPFTTMLGEMLSQGQVPSTTVFVGLLGLFWLVFGILGDYVYRVRAEAEARRENGTETE